MSQNSPSLEELRKSAERSRGDLAQTVGQLRTKVSGAVSDARETVSPDHLKAQLSDYIQTSGQRLLEQARENPLQALAIGAGVAYPLAGVVRSIPIPVLLVGSGLFLLSKQNQKRAVEKMTEVGKSLSASASGALDAGTDTATRTFHDLRDKAADSLASLGAKASDIGTSVTGSVSGAVRGAAFSVNSPYSEATAEETASASVQPGAAKQALNAAQANLASAASSITTQAGDLLDSASTASLDAVRRAKVNSAAISRDAGKYLVGATRQNPLVVGGLALAAGMVIASLLPRTRVEGVALGPANKVIKDKARAAASQGLDLAQRVASAAIEETTHRAKAEGFGADAVGSAVSDIGSRIIKVAENATTTAFATVEHTSDQAHDHQNDPRSTL